MSFSVIVPSKDGTNLVSFLNAIHINEPGPRVIVVDDGIQLSGVNSYRRDNVHFAWGIRPFIFSRNVNIGIKAAGPDDVVVMNDDALLTTPGGLSRLQQLSWEFPTYGLFAPSCNNTGNENQGPRGIGFRDEPRMVCFTCVYIPRRTINLVGLLDERFVGYGFDDDDYCLRVRQAGLKIGITDDVFVDHESLKSSFRGEPHTPANLHQNAVIFHAKWGMDNWGHV